MAFQREKGFTLIEVAIVMVIIGLVMGGGLAMVRTLTDRKFRNESIDYLNKAKEAVITFAQINGRLPWADTLPLDGLEDANQTRGWLPFITLGMPPADPYRRAMAYEINAGLITNIDNITNMVASCNAVMAGFGAASPQIIDADAGGGAAVSVAAVIVSAGPMDADGDGNVLDAIGGGDNTTGAPYIRNPPSEGVFDDLAVYITGNELFGRMCETVVLAVNGPGTFYTRDTTTGNDLGNAQGSWSIVSGTQIEIFSLPNGGGATVGSTPTTPIIITGQDRTIMVP